MGCDHNASDGTPKLIISVTLVSLLSYVNSSSATITNYVWTASVVATRRGLKTQGPISRYPKSSQDAHHENKQNISFNSDDFMFLHTVLSK